MYKRSSKDFNTASHLSNSNECLCPVNKKNAFESQSGKDSTAAADGKSFARNILPSSSAFSIFYPDAILSSAPNSNESRIFARSKKKIIAQPVASKSFKRNTLPVSYCSPVICSTFAAKVRTPIDRGGDYQ
jgi:hypothetical protein